MMDESDQLNALAARVRASHALGRSKVLEALFEFLLERSGAGASPKEIEIAAAVFGKRADSDLSNDASVRVYVHRLRHKLETYYAGPGAGEAMRLAIPKGEYRIVAEPLALGAAPRTRPRPWRRMLGSPVLHAAVAAAVLSSLAWSAGLWWRAEAQRRADPRASAPWAALLHDKRPITVVVGDYYIFGESDDTMEVSRLVREYSINSPEDLNAFLVKHPKLAGRYMDVDLYYLPVASAFALRDLLPLLEPAAKDRDRVRIVTASNLTADLLSRTDVVYLGYFSSLGLLRDPVFAGSRFQVGDSYDELIDQVSHRRYLSQEGGPDQAGDLHRDFGYFATFKGPNGNRIVIIAGTRDIAVMQTADAVTRRATLDAVTKQAGKTDAYEALYEVEGVKRTNLGGKLLLVSPLKAAKIWSAPPSALHFPEG